MSVRSVLLAAVLPVTLVAALLWWTVAGAPRPGLERAPDAVPQGAPHVEEPLQRAEPRGAAPGSETEPGGAETSSSEPVVGWRAKALLETAPESVQTAAARLPDLYATFKEAVERGDRLDCSEANILLCCSIVVVQFSRGQGPEPPDPSGTLDTSAGENGWWSFYQGDVFRFHESEYPEFAENHQGMSAGIRHPGEGRSLMSEELQEKVLARAEQALEWLSGE